MSDAATAVHPGREPWRPNLFPMLALLTAGCAISAYFLIDTYALREAAPQSTADGRSYVLRLSKPLDMAPEIKAGATRLIAAITQAREQAGALQAAIADRAARNIENQVRIAEFMEQIDQAEQRLADLKQEVRNLEAAHDAEPQSVSVEGPPMADRRQPRE
jgi:predicted O-linked N-acetylglucosamine transferase (SPINDLY family)